MQDPPQLTDFQLELVRKFFTLPQSDGFLIAGGSGLAAQALTTRPTEDLDFFTGTAGTVIPALEALEQLADAEGWSIERRDTKDGFCRFTVHGPEDVSIDLALDSPPGLPPAMTVLGPSFAPEELAGRKLLALFDRAAPRDLCDVYELSQRFSKTEMMQQAKAVDAMFNGTVLADMIRGRLARTADADLPTNNPEAVRAFYAAWLLELQKPEPRNFGGSDVGLPPTGRGPSGSSL